MSQPKVKGRRYERDSIAIARAQAQPIRSITSSIPSVPPSPLYFNNNAKNLAYLPDNGYSSREDFSSKESISEIREPVEMKKQQPKTNEPHFKSTPYKTTQPQARPSKISQARNSKDPHHHPTKSQQSRPKDSLPKTSISNSLRIGQARGFLGPSLVLQSSTEKLDEDDRLNLSNYDIESIWAVDDFVGLEIPEQMRKKKEEVTHPTVMQS